MRVVQKNDPVCWIWIMRKRGFVLFDLYWKCCFVVDLNYRTRVDIKNEIGADGGELR